MTYDMIEQRACVSVEIMLVLFEDLCKKEGVEVKLSREWVRGFLLSIDLSYFGEGCVWQGPKAT
eukprot:2732489-Amphidinium_carterae.1